MTAPGAKPVEIPKHTMPEGSKILVTNYEGTATYEKQGNDWVVIQFEARRK